MGLQFWSTPVGAMQYNGVNVAEATYNGVLVWQASPYPLDGEWSQEGGAFEHQVEVHHTIAEGGEFTLTMTSDSGSSDHTKAITGPWGDSEGPFKGGQYSFSVTEILTEGDVVDFGTAARTGDVSGTWSIVKN